MFGNESLSIEISPLKTTTSVMGVLNSGLVAAIRY